MLSPCDADDLRRRVRAGWRPELVFFLSPDAHGPSSRGRECLSQWYPAPMHVDGVQFPTAEHYMMWRKARIFGDEDTAQKILADDSPAVAKRLGREVRGFDGVRWLEHRLDVVRRGSVAKFRQHPRLAEFLLATTDCVLAEASPVDYIWGIGFAEHDEGAKNPLLWKGLNLLGFVLMETRDRLSSCGVTGA